MPSVKLLHIIFYLLISILSVPTVCQAEKSLATDIKEIEPSMGSVVDTDDLEETHVDLDISEEIAPKTSVLIPADPSLNNVSEKPLTIQMTPPRALKMIEEERRQSYGYTEFGYTSTDKTYGYTVDDNKGPAPKRQFGYEARDKTSFGYSDPGNTSIGTSGFGTKGYGYEGDSSSYGRREEKTY